MITSFTHWKTRRGRCSAFVLTASTLLLAALVCPGRVAADALVPDAQGWQVIKATPEGRLYHRPMQDSNIPQVMIETRFAAPPAAVYGVVTDYAHFAEFIPGVAESRIVRETGNVQWVFHRLHFAGPVADRVYALRSVGTIGDANPNAYRVEWTLALKAMPPHEEGIRPKQLSGYWELRPIDGGKTTEARYAVHSDPGGRIPDWLVTRMTDRYVRDVVRAVRARLERVGQSIERRH